MTPSRSSSAAIARGSCSTLSARPRASAADVGQLRLEAGEALGERLEAAGPRGRAPRASRSGLRDRLPRARPPRRSAHRGRARRPARSPRRAGPPRAGRGSRPPRRRAAGPPRSRPPRARELEPPERARAGSSASSASAARFARQRVDRVGHRRARLVVAAVTRRAGRAASARRAAAAGRAARGSRRAGPTSSASRAAVTVSSSSRAVDRPLADDLADGDERLREPVEQRLDARGLGAVPDEARVRARAEGQPQRVDQEALAGPGLAGDDVEARREREAQPVDEGEVGDGQLEQASARSAAHAPAHDGSSSTLWRSRSQNGSAPAGSTRRIGRSTARTSTTSPTCDREVLAAVDRDQRLVGVDDAAADDLLRADDDRPERREVGGDRRHDRGCG